MKVHQIISDTQTDKHKIKYRDVSCFCEPLRGKCSCFSLGEHYLQSSNGHPLQPLPSCAELDEADLLHDLIELELPSPTPSCSILTEETALFDTVDKEEGKKIFYGQFEFEHTAASTTGIDCYLLQTILRQIRVITAKKMVVVVDIDKVLTKYDLLQYYYYNLKWPWAETHFILSSECGKCHVNVTPISATGIRPFHFTLLMNVNDLKMLLCRLECWCDYCDALIYDHYPEDECKICS
ncbi:hypothetical protein evm_013252 [Chilo suppressalis]|nr:hypothetical protein evm_013252 [Chilo suppressalis]